MAVAATNQNTPQKKESPKTNKPKDNPAGFSQSKPETPQLDPQVLRQAEEAKARNEVAKADNAVAKAEEQQVKTAFAAQQAEQAGVQYGPPLPADFASPLAQQLQSLRVGLGNMGVDEQKIQEFMLSIQPKNQLGETLLPFVQERVKKFKDREERIKELKADTPNLLERGAQFLTLGLYDPTNDDEVARLQRLNDQELRNIFGIAQSALPAEEASKSAFARTAFQSYLGNLQAKKNFARQLDLVEVKAGFDSAQEETRSRKMFEIKAKEWEHEKRLEDIKQEDRLEVLRMQMEGKEATGDPKKEGRLLNFSQGGSTLLQGLYTAAEGVPSGITGEVYNGAVAAVNSWVSKKAFDVETHAMQLARNASHPEALRRGVTEARKFLMSTYATSKAREAENRKGAEMYPFFTEGMDTALGRANAFLDALEIASEKVQKTVRTRNGTPIVMDEERAIRMFLDDHKLMVVPDDPAASTVALESGFLPDGRPLGMDQSAAMTKARELGIWKNQGAVRRIALNRAAPMIARQRGIEQGKFERAQMVAYIESEINKMVKDAFGEEIPSTSSAREEVRKAFSKSTIAGEGMGERAKKLRASVSKVQGLRHLLEWDAQDILNEIEQGTATRKSFSLLEHMFRDRTGLAPILRKLGWNSLEDVRKKMGGAVKLTFPEKLITGSKK